ncbi:MAG: peptidylprolyl isomerase [Oscillospiraceae bacterium]|nr:peptidylprolyl isomerase [Oscillospiraceae bacterium]
MSASREKKKRQELLANGAVDPKAAREAEKKAAERKSNILYGTVAAIFVIVAVALVVYNSGIFQRNQTAVTIDGEKYTVAETGYYYNQVYQNYASFYSAMGMDPSALKSQPYGGSDDMTYDDFFKESAVDNMKYIHAAVKAAGEAGISLDSEDEAVVKQNVDSMKSAAASNGYSYGAYLKAMYGATITSSIVESCLRDQVLASKYAAQYSEENFVYTDEDIQAYYDEHKDTYDLIDGAYVTVSGSPEAKTDDEGNAVEATDEEKTAAMAAAKTAADEILASFEAGQGLEQLAEAKGATYSTTISSPSTTSGQWFYDASRKAGDTSVIEDASNSCYYVAVFNSRQRDDSAATYSVRHVLVTADNLDLPDDQEATNEQIEAKANEILAGWDGTEEGFANLAKTYSQDGNASEGGLYEDVPKGQMVAAFEDWCYEDGRQSGQTGIVQTNYGYHIMYFVGYGDTAYWHYACENALRSNDENTWRSGLIEATFAEVNESGMKNVG